MARQLLAVLAITTVHLVVCTNDTETNNIEVNAEEDSVGPSWMYKCESEDGCHRVSRPLPTNMTQAGQLYDNMDLCRMACGRFGGLWPRPMTAALSAQTVQIHPNYLRFEGGLRETANILRLLQEYPGAAGSLRGEARPHAVAGGCPQHIERNVAKSFSKTTLIPVSSAFTGCAILSIQCSTYYDNYMTCGSPLSSSMVSLMIWFDLIDAPPPTRDLLAEMSQILTQNLEAECGGQVTTVVETPVVIYINVKSSDLSLNWFTDESYILDMQSRGTDVAVHIVAETVFGIRHGLETLSQMVSSNRSQTPHSKECGLQLIAGAKIRDKPMYPHRGLVLDTSRNFIPIEAIKKTVDGMGASKMNVLHWHATDSHSFPLESPRVPLLTKYGAYSASEIYRVDEVTDLLKYARARGVRVILEIDSPAHAGNGWQWGEEYGLGELAVCVNAKPWRPLCIQPPCGQLNPANPNLYPILRDLYRDIAETWPLGELFHMGGDEVFMNCWNSSEEITSYMKNKGFERTTEGFIRLWAEFHAAILGIWDEETKDIGAIGNAPVMLWSSELTQPMRIQNFLNKDRYVIQVWEPETSPLLTQLSRLGYRVVASPKDVWYLDHGFWGTTKYANWRRMYMHMLPREPNVLGGEVAMWSEYVDANGLGPDWNSNKCAGPSAMYTVSKGPSNIVAKTRRGLGGGLERLERREAGGARREPGPDLDSMPKPVFYSNGRKTVHQRIHQDIITPQHEEMIRFINETWVQTTGGESEPSSPTGTIGSGSSSPALPTSLYYQDDEPSPVLRDFKPFDLETWWGKRLFQNITSSL